MTSLLRFFIWKIDSADSARTFRLLNLAVPWCPSNSLVFVEEIALAIDFDSLSSVVLSKSAVLSSSRRIVISSFILALPSSLFLGADLLGFLAFHHAGFYHIAQSNE